jgi:plasmid stabilization system protein ParE
VKVGRTRSFERQFDDLREFYEEKHRLRAAEKLVEALREAIERLEADPTIGRSYPGPYPTVAR